VRPAAGGRGNQHVAVEAALDFAPDRPPALDPDRGRTAALEMRSIVLSRPSDGPCPLLHLSETRLCATDNPDAWAALVPSEGEWLAYQDDGDLMGLLAA